MDGSRFPVLIVKCLSSSIIRIIFKQNRSFQTLPALTILTTTKDTQLIAIFGASIENVKLPGKKSFVTAQLLDGIKDTINILKRYKIRVLNM